MIAFHFTKLVCDQNLIWEETISTCSHVAGFWRVTGICLTVPRPRASLFLWAENNLSSFFSSSLRLLQYLNIITGQISHSACCLSNNSPTWLHYREAAVVGAAAWSDISLPPSWRRGPCRQAGWRSRGGPEQQVPHHNILSKENW